MRVASSNIWKSSQPELRLFDFLLSTARLLLLQVGLCHWDFFPFLFDFRFIKLFPFIFYQIIYAHEKAFRVEEFVTLKSLLCVLDQNKMTVSLPILAVNSHAFFYKLITC